MSGLLIAQEVYDIEECGGGESALRNQRIFPKKFLFCILR